jgi:50S ribosomal subunit-associated GTPase HflX
LDKALALEFNRRYGVNAVENALKIAEVVSKYMPTAVVFNMADLWTPPYSEEELSKALGLPVVYASATKRQGVEKLKELLGKGLPRGEVRPVKLEPPATAVVRTRKRAEPRLYLFDGERFTDALDGAEERPGERTPLLYSF